MKELYKQWCKETNRSGGILVHGSIYEFFEWLDNKGYLIKNKKLDSIRIKNNENMKASDALKITEEVRPIITESNLKDIFDKVKLSSLKGKVSCEVDSNLLTREVVNNLFSLGYEINYIGGTSYEISWSKKENKEVFKKPSIKELIKELFKAPAFRTK